MAASSASTVLELQVDGVAWRVRALGMSAVGSRLARSPLLLIGFHRGGEETAELETCVVARGLDRLSELELVEALRAAKPPPRPGQRKAFFPEASGKSPRGEG